MEERESFIFYGSFYKAISEIPDSGTRIAAYDAVIRYGLYGESPYETERGCSGYVAVVFEMAKPQIDANVRRLMNGKKGGRPKKKEES